MRARSLTGSSAFPRLRNRAVTHVCARGGRGTHGMPLLTLAGARADTPSSGIWQTVWLEATPEQAIEALTIVTDLAYINVTVACPACEPGAVAAVAATDAGAPVTSGSGPVGSVIALRIPSPRLWSPSSPHLYDLLVSTPGDAGGDSVTSYAGMRTFTLGWADRPLVPPTGPQPGVDRPGGDLPGSPFTLPRADPNACWAACNGTEGCAAWAYAVPACDAYAVPTCWLKGADQATSSNKCRVSGAQGTPGVRVRVPLLNGARQFLAGWLDQSYWPDGQYTAPSDEALAFDVQAVRDFGMNFVRAHASSVGVKPLRVD